MTFNRDKDSLATFVRKSGGIASRSADGFYTYQGADFAALDRFDLINNKTGLEPDTMRELAVEVGYLNMDSVRDLWDALRGDILARSATGRGSVFTSYKEYDGEDCDEQGIKGSGFDVCGSCADREGCDAEGARVCPYNELEVLGVVVPVVFEIDAEFQNNINIHLTEGG